MRRRFVPLVVVICLSALPARPTAAQVEQGVEPVEPVNATSASRTLAVTISGGGSKGAYMAGQLYFMSLVRRHSGSGLVPRIFTGASAGAINAFLAALTSCLPEVASPTESVLWRTWIPTGLDDLFVPEDTTAAGALSRSGFRDAVAEIERIWADGLPADCDVIYGATISRVRPRRVAVADHFPELPRTLEKVLVRIRGRGPGSAPHVENLTGDAPYAQVLLPLDGPGATPLESLEELVFASSAFPIGFAPVNLRHCLRRPGDPPECTVERAERAWFMDGGVFDNQPLGLAVNALFLDEASRGNAIHHIPDGARFYYLDPALRAYPPLPSPVVETEFRSAFDVIDSLLGMVGSAQSSELLAVFENHPEIRERLLASTTSHPPTSGTFSGFIEQSFREYDFFLGIYDAYRSIREARWSRWESTTPVVSELSELIPANAPPEVRSSWRRFECLRFLFDGAGSARSCAGEELRDFRILAQVSLDRLYNHCVELRGDSAIVETSHDYCRRVREGAPAQRIAGLPEVADEDRLAREGEGELDYLFRLLAQYEFRFADLGLDRSDADLAPATLKRFAEGVVTRFSEAQLENGRLVDLLGQLGIDYGIDYVPPAHSFHLALGSSVEGGYSVAIPSLRANWIRLTLAVELGGLSTLLDASNEYFAVTPLAGFEIELMPVSGPLAQVRIGARGGFQFSTADGFFQSECDFAGEDAMPCSRPIVELYLMGAVLGMLRLQLSGVFGPAATTGQAHYWAIRPTLGVNFNSPF